jgi:DNA polymerase-3 subunit beta
MKTSELLNAVKKFKKIKNTSDLPILENILNDNGTMTFTNLHVSYTTKSGFPGRFLIEMKKLDKILSKLPKDSEINVTCEDKITISVIGGGKFALPTEDVKDYPFLIESKENIGKITPDDVSLIRKAVKYTAVEIMRPVYEYVLIGKHIVSTDAHRLVYFKHNQNTNQDFTMPAAAVQLLSDTNYNVSVNHQKNWVKLDSDSDAVEFRQFVGNYPDYEAVIPQNCSLLYKVDNKELQSAIKLAEVAANETTKLIRFKFNGSVLRVMANDMDFDTSYSQDIACKKLNNTGEGIEIGFKSTFLLDLLADADKTVTISMSDPSRAALINDDMLLMPMIIN